MKRIEISAEKHAAELRPLVFGESSPPIAAMTWYTANTSIFVTNMIFGFSPVEQKNVVSPGSGDLTVGDLLHVLRESQSA